MPAYTTGEFAKKLGVSVRTLQYYDKIDLLKPTFYKETGHRRYTDLDIPVLQKILTLKFIGFSLVEIKEVLNFHTEKESFIDSLNYQKNTLELKKQHIDFMIKAITSTEKMLEETEIPHWDRFEEIIKTVTNEERWFNQYKNSTHLKTRINLHEKYSVNKSENWHKECFSKLKLENNEKVLDIGCGIGNLWKHNFSHVPEDTAITLADYSKGMIDEAKKNVGENRNYQYEICSVEKMPFPDNSFDIVVANHMLYHAEDIITALNEIKRVLKKNGRFIASTIGNNHLKEIKNLVRLLSPEAEEKMWDFSKKFSIENGQEILNNYFSQIEFHFYDDSLSVVKSDDIINYIISLDSLSGIIDNSQIKQIKKIIDLDIKKYKSFNIQKSIGIFIAKT